MNTARPGAIRQVRSVEITEDPRTGGFTYSTTNCGTLLFENAIPVPAWCTPSWNGVVADGTMRLAASGVISDDVQFQTPFGSAFFGCAWPPCARYVIDITETGSIVSDGMVDGTTPPIAEATLRILHEERGRQSVHGGSVRWRGRLRRPPPGPSGCLSAAKAIPLPKNASDDAKDKLWWKRTGGREVAQVTLGDPTVDAAYALRLYTGAATSPVAVAAIPAGAGWSVDGSVAGKALRAPAHDASRSRHQKTARTPSA